MAKIDYQSVIFKNLSYLKKWIFLFLFLLSPLHFFSLTTQPVFYPINLEDGLSQSEVFCIIQDGRGFMWFGTADGLNRFDGYQFFIYKNKPFSKNSISSNYIQALAEDHEKRLWIGTLGGGLNLYNRDSETFTEWRLKKDDPTTLSHDNVSALCETLDGENSLLWVGTDNGLNCLVNGKGKFRRYFHDPQNINSLCDNRIQALFRDDRGGLWIGTKKGLDLFNLKEQQITHFRHDPNNPASLSDNDIACIYQDSDGYMWIGTAFNGLNRLDPKSREFSRYLHEQTNPKSISGNRIRAIQEDSEKNFWIATYDKGLNRLDRKSGDFEHFIYEKNKSGGMISNYVLALCEDRSGILWISNGGKGVVKYERHRQKFQLLQSIPGERNSLKDDFIWSILEDHDGILWIGTDVGGLNRYDRKTNQWRAYQTKANDPSTLSSDEVRVIIEDPNPTSETLWIGLNRGGMNRFSKKTGKCRRYLHDPKNPESLGHNFVQALCFAPDGGLWIGTRGGGLDRFDPQTEKFRHYQNSAENEDSLGNNFIGNIYLDAQGILWIGTDGGLDRFDPQSGHFRHYIHNPENKNSLSYNRIYSIYPAPDGHLWIGTYGGGLNYFDPASGTFTAYTEADGLCNDAIYSILADDMGNLWISTNRGLSRFNITSKVFKNYDTKDGTQGPEFNRNACFKAKNGELFFGGSNGVNLFNPRLLPENHYVPPVVITGFRLSNLPIPIGPDSPLKKSIGETSEIKLSYRDTMITLEFTSLNYSVSGKNQYAYMMVGLDKEWNHVGNRRFVSYASIPPGKYTFKVKGSNNDGIWNETGVSLKITITPPFWQTWWFRTLAVLAILCLILFVFRVRIRQLKKRKEELEQLVDKRTWELEKSNTLLSEANTELEKLSLVASKTDNAVIIMDPAGNIEWINDGFTRMYQYSLEQLIAARGRNITDISNNPHIREIFADFLKQDKSIVYETSSLRRDGQRIWLQTTLTPILDDSGRLKKVIAIDSEITKIMEAEMAAERANQSKSEFLARMSHEIRTPMNGVIGFSDMLLDTDLDEEQTDCARSISRSGEALITLLNDILDFSKIEAGELILDPLDFDPELTVFDICDLIMPRIANKPVEVFCRIGDNVPAFVKADPGRFRQVIINLMGNAAKFTEQGSIELSLEVAREENNRQQLLTRIKDTGIGIPEDKLETVFEVFQQADGSTTRKYGGTGLGLAICRQIACLMDGNVWVESKPGQGSTFYFSCWVEKSAKTAEKYSSALAGKRVLVVDDNATNLEILSHVLLLNKMEVVELSDPRQVIQLIKEYHQAGKPFDICIMDIQMPRFSGHDIAQDIRRLEPPLNDLPLLAFSSSTLSRSKKFRESGFNGFLPKPVRRAKLIRMIERLLGMAEGEGGEIKSEEIVTQHTLTEEGKHSVHILLAEDNAINQKLAMFMLEKAGYKLTLAENGQQAIDIFTVDPDMFDLILMDVQMPVMDGKTATQKLRQMGYTTIPIVAMTAEAMKGDEEKCLAAGMDDYIPKPIKRDVVYKMVKKWCLDRHQVPIKNDVE